MIECCNPNVVLVEKTVSRDIQGSLLERGITLVFDVKLHRLERIARCTGSQIICSTDILVRPKLKQCDSFRVEKFVEEHNCAGEGGKKPNKTLMFLEGCPRPLGCTVSLISVLLHKFVCSYYCVLVLCNLKNGSDASKPLVFMATCSITWYKLIH